MVRAQERSGRPGLSDLGKWLHFPEPVRRGCGFEDEERCHWDGDELMTCFFPHTAAWRRRQTAEPRRRATPDLPRRVHPNLPLPLLRLRSLARLPRLPPCGPSRYCSSRPCSPSQWQRRPCGLAKLGHGVIFRPQEDKPLFPNLQALVVILRTQPEPLGMAPDLWEEPRKQH